MMIITFSSWVKQTTKPDKHRHVPNRIIFKVVYYIDSSSTQGSVYAYRYKIRCCGTVRLTVADKSVSPLQKVQRKFA